MAKKTKMTKDTCEKLIKTVEVAIAPAVISGAAIWGFDIGVYVAAVTAVIVAVLRCIEVFLNI